jgi:hypothetical protein
MTWPPDSSLCPPVVVGSLTAYVKYGRPTGGFLEAVLSNDLREAIGRADGTNGPALAHILSFIYDELPSSCWGSPAKYENWLRTMAQTRDAERAVAR